MSLIDGPYVPMALDLISRQRPRKSRFCPIEEAKLDPTGRPPGRPPRHYNLLTLWPSSQCPVLDPDADDAGPEGVSIPVAGVHTPCGAGLSTLVVTSYRSDPGPGIVTHHVDGRWLHHELV